MRVKITLLTIMFMLLMSPTFFMQNEHHNGLLGEYILIVGLSQARASEADKVKWAPTKPYPINNVDYPDTEE